jgi:hypothetical protein
MLSRAHAICAYLVILLACIHIALTGHTFGGWSSGRALFFIGSGLFIGQLGFTNLLFLRAGKELLVRTMCHVSNVLGAGLFGLGVFVLPMPQVFLLFGLMIAQTVMGLAHGTMRARTG